MTPGGVHVHFRTDLWVEKDGVDQVGRVFANQFHASQNGAWHRLHPDEFGENGLVEDVVFYVVGDDGTVFKVSLKSFDGISSGFTADALGVWEAATCDPTDKSAYSLGEYRAPKYVTRVLATESCDVPFVMFPDPPSGDLPQALTAAQGWEGPLYPRYKPPAAPRVAGVEAASPIDRARPYASRIMLDLGGFKGTYVVGVDVNGDGDLADAQDVTRRLEKLTPDAQPVEWAWDGRDGAGAAVAATAKPKLNVRLERGNRYSLVLSDVETLAGGAAIEQLAGFQVTQNGGNPVRPPIHWDDTDVANYSPAGKAMDKTLTTAPKLVKTPAEGLAASGAAHGWKVPADTGVAGSWGNDANISFNIWNDLSLESTLKATREFADRCLEIQSKTAELLPAAGGERRVAYTVTLKNTGDAAFTAARPASIV
ncbi:MAG: hypothetical protein LBL01_02900, partial [Bifidobacteriaceae bacterium]|nr:hypothetical protein [Bifidobacteriaceae bacterium]